MKRFRNAAVPVMAALTIGLLGGCGDEDTKTSETTSSITAEFDANSDEVKNKTQKIEDLINSRFYFSQDEEKREEAYYDGLLEGLNDPYSVYYTADEYSRMMEDDSGEYVGIGAMVTQNAETGVISVVRPFRGSPAAKAGLQPKDVFVEINGMKLTSDMLLEDVINMIRGEENTVAEFKMYREGEKDYLTFRVERKKVEHITVDYEVLDNGFGYIYVEQFIENTYDQFKEAVDYLTSRNVKALIIDIRDNPGGFTSSACSMVDYLLEDDHIAEGDETKTPGLLITMKDKSEKIIQKDSCSDQHSVDLPIAVLVDEYSASSSEIFAGALRDHKKAILVGVKTYGKGIVQVVYPLGDGSAVKLTIAAYFLPSGTSVQGDGLVPDAEIEMDMELRRQIDLPHNKDVQLQRAITELGGEPLP